ncbi:hypothetical protein [Mycobacterium sp. TY814]|uniref:hypothetical protein n=1 Tax=unclassified Mycobacterium TaxID=2642494 RepID=UPI002740EDB2|nr:hypothetical protein [Mycobacterium sp. TY814]MDP7722433.1 hypothetical protein [Mycobacterium sp. TY814]
MSDISPDLLLDNLCISAKHPWSIIELSTTNAQLAGLFAGFMIIALTTIISKEWGAPAPVENDAGTSPPRPQGTQQHVTHILVFLSMGVIILVLDAYLFGSVRATKPPAAERFRPMAATASNYGGNLDGAQSAQQVCAYSWVKFMPAAGLLALGAAILGAGLAWMLARYAADSDAEAQKWLTALGNIIVGMILGGTTALLVYDSTVFTEEMYYEFSQIDHETMVTALVFIWIFGTVLLIATVCAVTARIVDLTRERADWHAVLNFQLRSLRVPAGLTAAYLFSAVGISGLSSMSSTLAVNAWTSPHARLWISIILCLVFPGAIYFFIMRLMPGAQRRRQAPSLIAPPTPVAGSVRDDA